ncbi:hemerythrin domain-containing protein [Actinoalloteichus sp. GBA129-24]|uniref:hemerythrin domain-containing protein n=1 Tax=Actinoalloteichus sp. GBA129-24 TaxID=1612551 RepID=UPI00095084D9|nr:hemerythrin domain-containing protein [Actinoalloteichus sp. GBA129-24]APU22943.1 hemerythrin HHE cation binding domain-containing protein [Actinoalloteichus sp. GBA129-24]
MAEGEKARLTAWSHELRAVHQRLRETLRITRDAVRDGETAGSATRDLLLFCHGFCAALTDHHEGEDRSLFPAIEAAHPELRETLRLLEQDHSMMAYLLAKLQTAVERAASPAELDQHLEGIAAIMENHFRYEERSLLSVLDTLGLDANPRDVLGPL